MPLKSAFLLAASATFPTATYSGTPIVLTVGDLQKMVSVTTGASDSILTLPTSGMSNGSIIYVKKADSGVGKVIINTTLAYLMTINDTVLFIYDGSNWIASSWQIKPIVDIFTANGTWTKRPLLKEVNVMAIGGGGGGGGGRRGAAGTVRCAGAGAQSAGYTERQIDADMLSATHSITCAVGGAGGTVPGDNSDGNPGATGDSSSFGTLVIGLGGSNGSGGSVSVAGSSGSSGGVGTVAGPIGGTSSATGGAGGIGIRGGFPGGGGGGGGGISSGNANSSGAAGGVGGASIFSAAGGTAGTAGVSGGAGASQSVTFPNGFAGGGGGGGGGSASSSAAGDGGAGGFPGGGGGGGAASTNTFSGGAGGAGGAGAVYVVNYFN